MHEISNAHINNKITPALLKSGERLIIHTDGGIRPVNPGGAMGYAFWLSAESAPDVSLYDWRAASPPFADNTVSYAEYYAMFRALHWLYVNGQQGRDVLINTDSKFLANQINYEQTINMGKEYGRLAKVVRKMAQAFPCLEVRWVSRDDNGYADYLADLALNDLGYQKGRVKKSTITGSEPYHGHFDPARELSAIIQYHENTLENNPPRT